MHDADVQRELFAAAARGSVEDVHKLISQGAELHTPDDDGNTVVHIAARHRHLAVIEALHELGIDINALNDFGWTPVYMAAYTFDDDDGDVQFLKALADLGADVNIPSYSEWSPLQISARMGHCGSVKSLIEAGADMDAVNCNGLTPVYLSACMGDWDICSLLVNAGADITSLIGVPLALPTSISSDILGPFQIDLRYGDDPNAVASRARVFSTVKLLSSVSRYSCSRAVTDFAASSASATCTSCADATNGVSEGGARGNTTGTSVLQFERALMAAFLHQQNATTITIPAPAPNPTPRSSGARSDGEDHCAMHQALNQDNPNCLPQPILSAHAAIHHTSYLTRRWLSMCAWRVHSQSPLGRSTTSIHSRFTSSAEGTHRGHQQLSAVARQYAQLVSLFADHDMLADLLALRLTCQSNNYRQRFPVTRLRAYHELEVNLVESFIATDASHLVSTGLVNSLLALCL